MTLRGRLMSDERDEHERQFWEAVISQGLPRFRFLRRPLALVQVDAALGGHPGWGPLRGQLQPGDQVLPFRLPRSGKVWGHRSGYVVLRRGKFVGGVVTEVS
jgi:hypothetical protein